MTTPATPPRTLRRALIIGGLTLLVASAVLTPKLNPLTRSRVMAAENIGLVWNDINLWRIALSQAVRESDDGAWPADIQQHRPQGVGPHIGVRSPGPWQLEATISRDAELGILAGTQLLFTYDPASMHWRCRNGAPPMPAGYMPISCEGMDASPGETGMPGTLLLWCALLFIGAAIFWVLRHPLIGPGQLRPGRLRRTPYPQLPQVDRLLRLSGRLRAVLQAAQIALPEWQRAVAYARHGADRRLATLAERLGTRARPADGWDLPGIVVEWQFANALPVSLDRCLAFVPETGCDEDELIRRLMAAPTGSDVMLVLAPNTAQAPMPRLQGYCEDRTNLFVMIDGAAQSECLLSRNPADVLLRLLAAQLRVTRISPYQTRGAITSAGAFFGREQLLARVIGREPANYLVVGGRQLGKSSLLKAVQRRLQDHPHIVCHYLSLRDHRLAPRMALQFGLPAATTLDDIIAHLESTYAGKRLFLMIDEADLFFRDESGNGYRQLAALRALSDEGRCWFMLAGFWDLYATAVLDYQSPLRNFGEVLTIGGLETEACRELATKPLARLRYGVDNPRLVEQLVEASGQRANLLAILCHECLELLGSGERVIEARHTAQAMASTAVQDALAGWGRLSNDETACRIDRIAVYHTALHGKTSLAALADLFAGSGRATEPEALRQALARLQLAYVLRRCEGGFMFAIPLFLKQFEAGETAVLLRQELAATPH
ncbi:ATP-binding protein [Massilia atriviolacea]|uniref:ATP-binding protein n=1 Tax=Massilia atriviolacea TaxID=2495579 RepID=A0A430HTX3_9BURK|nr:ATP-binding protein [Massilia atriviolacea]RSZ60922.1 ATP-binding protein [Massilia atriviolacea]